MLVVASRKQTKSVYCEFDWEFDEVEEYTNNLIAAEELSEDQKDAFKARQNRKQALEELSQEKLDAINNTRFYKFYPLEAPDNTVMLKTSYINRWFDAMGNIDRVLVVCTKGTRGLYAHSDCDGRDWEFDKVESLGKVARERIPGELSPSNYPGRHVARDKYPQRHVARESVKMSLGIVAMTEEDAFFVDYVEGGLCVDNTDAGIVERCNSGSNKDKGKDFKHTLKHGKDDLSLVQLCSHLRIEESLTAQESDKGNVVLVPTRNQTWNVGNVARLVTSRGIDEVVDAIAWWIDSGFGYYNNGHVHYKRMFEMSKDDLIPAIDENPEKYTTYDASRFCYVYLLHAKDEALDKFKISKTEVELQQNDLIKTLRTDRGDEYYDPVFFQSIGIIHETTALYTPRKNGVAERKNRALKEIVNSMLSWACRAVVRLLYPKKKTLGEKGIDCIFVGYAEHYKVYRFYVIEPNDSVSINSIIESRDAIFDENRFSSIPKPKDIMPNSVESQRDDHSDDVPSEIPEPRKGKRVQKAKSYDYDFQLYLVEGSRDHVVSQYSYCYSIEEDPRTYDEAMQSQDAAFWKEAIDNEIGSIMENNT
ncbi:zinc finger, CCHC-type containing protein [Tanacetum coccineum]|uniref:Zinc finger, CCHC-type containing protein n=1 Tax=Tanacetum coccineum TaxID=301880 RepID=A0ABQ5DK56_9ASTR